MSTGTSTAGELSLEETAARAKAILDEIERAVIGKRPVLELVLGGLLADGHLLLDDLPGVAKTLTARSLATVTGMAFHRIQFTPDLLPADITGAVVLDREHGRLRLPARSGLRQPGAGRRGEPGSGQDPGGAAGGHAGGSGHRRRHHPSAPPAVPRGRHPEPDRVRGHLPAARGPAGPVPAPHHGRLPVPRGRVAAGRPSPAAGHRRGRAHPGGDGGRCAGHAARPGAGARGRAGRAVRRGDRHRDPRGAPAAGGSQPARLAGPGEAGPRPRPAAGTGLRHPRRREGDGADRHWPTASCSAASCGCGGSPPRTCWPACSRACPPRHGTEPLPVRLAPAVGVRRGGRRRVRGGAGQRPAGRRRRGRPRHPGRARGRGAGRATDRDGPAGARPGPLPGGGVGGRRPRPRDLAAAGARGRGGARHRALGRRTSGGPSGVDVVGAGRRATTGHRGGRAEVGHRAPRAAVGAGLRAARAGAVAGCRRAARARSGSCRRWPRRGPCSPTRTRGPPPAPTSPAGRATASSSPRLAPTSPGTGSDP